MNKYISFIGLLFLSTILFGKTVSENQRKIIAENFIRYNEKNQKIVSTFSISDKESSVKVFCLENKGFIAVTNDDFLPPILAYSFTSDLNEKNLKINPLFAIMQTDMENRLKFYSDNNFSPFTEKWIFWSNSPIKERDFEQWPPQDSSPTDGWVKTTWYQTGIYNAKCPIDNNNNRSVVGCVATALSQIVHFNEYVGNPIFNDSDSFVSGYQYINIDGDAEERDFPTFEELTDMMQIVSNKYVNGQELNNDDIAALNYACGVVVRMAWSSGGSGAYTSDVVSALLNKYNYNSASWYDYYDQELYVELENSMRNMKPAELSISDSDGNNGHAIICDGYNNNNFYHLNFGWGTSNSTCWYTLPEGMPANYSVVSGAAVNITGGRTPYTLNGNVITGEESPVGTHIKISGRYNYEVDIVNSDGTFEVPLFLPGTYHVEARKDRIYYTSYEVELEENENLSINLFNFDFVTGNVSGSAELENSIIKFYQENELKYQGSVNNDGSFSIADVMPGEYYGTVSAPNDYFGAKSFMISENNQQVNFSLEKYDKELSVGYYGYDDGMFTLPAVMETSLCIKLDGDENVNRVLKYVKFKAPFNDEQSKLYAQFWKNNELIEEIPVNEFSQGEWITVDLSQIYLLNNVDDYFVGFKTIGEDNIAVYHDQGPVKPGKGAFMRRHNWSYLGFKNYNFMIEAGFVAKESGKISGVINVPENTDYESISVFLNDYRTGIDLDGNFEINVPNGNYSLVVKGEQIEDFILNNIMVEDNQNVTLETISLTTENNHVNELQATAKSYPNPFFLNDNMRNGINIKYNIVDEGDVKIEIFNVKGKLVKTLKNEYHKKDSYYTTWNARDKNNDLVSSGIYFYKITTPKSYMINKILLIK